jgi:hypothetical protein
MEPHGLGPWGSIGRLRFGIWNFEFGSGRIDHHDQFGFFITQIVKLVWET